MKNSIQTSLRQNSLAWLCASVQWSVAESCSSCGQGSDGELAYHALPTLASQYRYWCCRVEHSHAITLALWMHSTPAVLCSCRLSHVTSLISKGWEMACVSNVFSGAWRRSCSGVSPPPPDSRWLRRCCFSSCLFFLYCYSCNQPDISFKMK